MLFDMLYWVQTFIGAMVEALGMFVQGAGVFMQRWGETAQVDTGFFWVSAVSVVLFVGMAMVIRAQRNDWADGFLEGVEEIVQMEYEERLDKYVGRRSV